MYADAFFFAWFFLLLDHRYFSHPLTAKVVYVQCCYTNCLLPHLVVLCCVLSWKHWFFHWKPLPTRFTRRCDLQPFQRWWGNSKAGVCIRMCLVVFLAAENLQRVVSYRCARLIALCQLFMLCVISLHVHLNALSQSCFTLLRAQSQPLQSLGTQSSAVSEGQAVCFGGTDTYAN